GALRLSPLRRGLAIDSTVDIFTFYVPHRHVYGEQWIKFMKDGVNATPLPTVNTTGYIDHAAFLGTINRATNKIPKHLFQGYLNIYNNYFKAPWMPDRTEANPNELNQDDARYGFRCCHLKNIWTAPLPPETELSCQMTTSTTSIDIMGLQAAYANLRTDQVRDYFMQRYHDVISSFGGKTSYDARSEERFSRNAETDLVCRLLLEKKKKRESDVLDVVPLVLVKSTLELAQPGLPEDSNHDSALVVLDRRQGSLGYVCLAAGNRFY